MIRELFYKHVAQTSDAPLGLEITGAQGVYLIDTTGKQYIDLISGISVSNVGHCNPRVVKAICDQALQYSHILVYGENIYKPQVHLAKKLAEICGEGLDVVYFVNSGSEAVEGAIKLAKRYTGRPNVISFNNAYHGSTHLCLSLMHNNSMNRAYRPLVPGIQHFSFNQYSVLDSINDHVAAVIVEPVQGEAGAVPADNNFLLMLRQKCDETGTLLIFDEVQTGIGRTGTFFAFQSYQVKPDILVSAKALGGGMPLGAFISSVQIMNCLAVNPPLGHITTFGGHPVSCSAALAAIQVIEEDKLLERVFVCEAQFRKALVHPEILQISGKGLLLAVHLSDESKVKKVIKSCLEQGLVTDWFLFNDKALRIAPPLCISDEEIQKSCEIILQSLSAL